MSKNILSLIGLVALLLAAFGAGYYFRSQNCLLAEKQTVATPTPTTIVTATATPTATTTPTPQTEAIFSNYNSAAVSNQPTKPTTFTLAKARTIYLIQDYHWNGAKGKTPGTIGLKDERGKVYGPWQAEGAPGQGGVPNAYWTVYPNEKIPAGTYTIVDSDPASWAQNSGSGGAGMSQVYALAE